MSISSSPQQLLDALRDSYADLCEALAQCKSSGLGESIRLFFRSQGNPKLTQTLQKFDPVITAQIEDLAFLLDSSSPEEADSFAAQALEQVLFYQQEDRTVGLSLVAFEGQAHTLIPFLTPAHRAEFAERYRKRTPSQIMMPHQKRLLSELSG